MRYHRRPRASLRQLTTFTGGHGFCDLILRPPFRQPLSRANVFERQQSTGAGVAKAPTDNRDEGTELFRLRKHKARCVPRLGETQVSEQPQLSAVEPVSFDNQSQRSVVRRFIAKRDGKPHIRYTADVTDPFMNRVSKNAMFSATDEAREAELPVDDFKHVVKLLEDATPTTAQEVKVNPTEEQGPPERQEHESIDDMEFEQLENILDDITYAPLHTPVTARRVHRSTDA